VAVWTYELQQKEKPALAFFFWGEGLQGKWTFGPGRNCTKGCQDFIYACKPQESAYTRTQTASKRPRALSDEEQYLVKVTCGANASVNQGGRKKATYQPQANLALHNRFGAPRMCGCDQELTYGTAPSGLAALTKHP